MTSTSHVPGPLELRAAEIEAAIARTAARCSEVPVVESSILRLLTLMGRQISALLEQLRAIIAQFDRGTQCYALPGFDTSETSPRATPAEQPG
jgi:hypothetical protein